MLVHYVISIANITVGLRVTPRTDFVDSVVLGPGLAINVIQIAMLPTVKNVQINQMSVLSAKRGSIMKVKTRAFLVRLTASLVRYVINIMGRVWRVALMVHQVSPVQRNVLPDAFSVISSVVLYVVNV